MRSSPHSKWASFMVREFGTNNPYEICQYLNINVSKVHLGSLNGYYTQSSGKGHIYINNALDEHMQRAICAHELGHAVMHTDVNIRFMVECTFFSKSKFEREANLFGAHLLLHDIRGRIADYENLTHYEIAAVECVPVEYIELILLYGMPIAMKIAEPEETTEPVTPVLVVTRKEVKPQITEAEQQRRRAEKAYKRIRSNLKAQIKEYEMALSLHPRKRRLGDDEFEKYIKDLKQ